jgi:hypothetical protein
MATVTNVFVSSLNPVGSGTNVVLTSSISAIAPGAGTPTGNIIFKDGSVGFGTNALNSSAAASFTNASFSHGSHVLSAEYAGDGNFTGSTNTLIELIDSPPVAVNVGIQGSPFASVKFRVTTLLSHDSDPDNDAVTLISVGPPSSAGGAVLIFRGWIIYMPPPGYTNNDTFPYTIADSSGLQASSTVSVSVVVANSSAQNLESTANQATNVTLVQFNAIPSRSYTVQYAASLASPSWQSLGQSPADGLGRLSFTDSNAISLRYYRSTFP